MDLVQWLGKQLDEEERLARACPGNGEWDADGIAFFARDLNPEAQAHIVAHDPARVLCEIEAKRDLLRLAERAHDYHETFMNGFASALEGTLRRFALAYADRPGYKAEEWRP